MSDDQSERGLYERIQEMDADIKRLEDNTEMMINWDVTLRRLRENVNVLLGEGDAWRKTRNNILADDRNQDPGGQA